MRRHGRAPGLVAVLTGVALALTAGSAGALTGSPLDTARARAAQLRTAIDGLALRAEQRSEDFDTTQDQLSRLVTEHVRAERALAAARADAAGDGDEAARRVRAMYEAGGQFGLYSSLLEGTGLHDVLTRYQTVRSLVTADTRAVARAGDVVAAAAKLEAKLRDLAAQQTQLERRSRAQADQVQALLAQQRALLASASADVVRLADEQRAAAQAAAERAFRARLAAAVPTGAGPVTASPYGAIALAVARTQIGKPYLWGAEGPAAFDCSGLTSWAYAKAGHPIDRTSRQQWYDGPHVGLTDLAPGDLLFWATDPADPATIHHVALYAGDGMMVAAPHTGALVTLQPVYLTGYAGAVRPGAASVSVPIGRS